MDSAVKEMFEEEDVQHEHMHWDWLKEFKVSGLLRSQQQWRYQLYTNKSECKHIDGNVMVDSDALIHVCQGR